MQMDAVIFGGGAAGLWLLDVLHRRRLRVVLLEAGSLGQGQTVASQGIIHSGLKYMLDWRPTGAAWKIREMPGVWRSSLQGEGFPRLTQTQVRTEFCYLWQTNGFMSRAGMFFARWLLQSRPRILNTGERPEFLKECPGTVARIDEQVIAPASFIADLARQHASRILAIDAENGLKFTFDNPGHVQRIQLRHPRMPELLELEPEKVVFTAGTGNRRLREMVGLTSPAMQTRPLHMVLVRGALPHFNGHCIDGSKTRVTITSDTDSAGRTVWQIGGQIAEIGVKLSEDSLLRRAHRELQQVLPAVDLEGTEWSTYRVDRAEGMSAQNLRPDTPQVLVEGNVLTAWPTKLALAPQLANDLAVRLPTPPGTPEPLPAFIDEWPRPEVALPPWETAAQWWRLNEPAFA
jgi:glycerol-3-phosphate dehydrogenase